MSQKQKSEGEIKWPILVEEIAESMTGPSQAEILLRVTSGIAAELIKANDSGQSVSLNEVRAKISKKHGYGGVPRLVDIISAIPDDYKKALLPKLRARPIRTASGVRFVPTNLLVCILLMLSVDRCGCSHVQASPMSAHSYDGQHLRVREMNLSLMQSYIRSSDIVLVVPTPISTTAHRATLAMNQQV